MHPDLAYDFFYKLKWPNGYACPKCRFKAAYIISTRNRPLYQCKKCDHQTTLTANTVMQNTRTPLQKWMTAVKLVCRPDSVNAVQLTSILDVTYKTAFYMLQKIRKMLTAYDRNCPLTGKVHASYSYPKSRRIAGQLRRDVNEIPIFVGGSFNCKGDVSYLKLKPGCRLIAHSKFGIAKFRDRHVGPGCRSFEFHKGTGVRNIESLPVHLANVIEWIQRTFKGVSDAYLENYLDEFSFRINHGKQMNEIESAIGRCLVGVMETVNPTRVDAA